MSDLFLKMLNEVKEGKHELSDIPPEPEFIEYERKENSNLLKVSKLPIWNKINSVPDESTMILGKSGVGKSLFLSWMKSQIIIDRLGKYSEIEEDDLMEMVYDRYRYDLRKESEELLRQENKFIILDQWFSAWSADMPKTGKDFNAYYNFMSKIYKTAIRRDKIVILCTNRNYKELGFPEDLMRWVNDIFVKKIVIG